MIVPKTREQYSAHIPALHLLCSLGWSFLSTVDCLVLRGAVREAITEAAI